MWLDHRKIDAAGFKLSVTLSGSAGFEIRFQNESEAGVFGELNWPPAF